MKLRSFGITNFRSIEDSGNVELGQTLCLVGKNEAGKTAVLQALAGLNPHPSTSVSFEVERDYPRRYLPEYKTRHGDEDAVVIRTSWELSDSEVDEFETEFGVGLCPRNVVCTRRYNDKAPTWTFSLDFSLIIRHLIEDERLSAVERNPLQSATTTDELRKALKGLATPTDKQSSLLDRLDKYPDQNVTGAFKKILNKSLPKFMYFSHYDRMEGQIRLDTYPNRLSGAQLPAISQGERVFVDFLEYAGTSVEEIASSDTFEGLNAKCEGASNRITTQLLEYWTQNPNLEIEVRVTKGEPGDAPPFNAGVIARARVKNNLHKVTVPFSERSAGFIWFFSFLVKFAQVQKGGGPLVLLLDEPGLTLHGKAQADLLRYFDDKLAPYHQVIFSTHSPFMVPADRLPEVRIVEDHIFSPQPGRWASEGTKVRGDALAVDRDTLFPLQGALGYEITQTLFVGKNILLVEGPGDILFLHAWSNVLALRGRMQLDARWTVCPAGGIDKIQPFVSLFSGAKLNIAVLSDFAKADKRKFESLRQNKILESGRLLNFAGLLGLEEADAEDTFATQLYCDIVNQAFALPEQHKITAQKIDDVQADTSRLVKRMEACFNLLPADFPEFDHFTPAAWLFRNLGLFDVDNEATRGTLDRAEAIIKTVNALL